MKKTYSFNFNTGEFDMDGGNPVVLTDINALKMWIQKTLRTQLNRYSMYKKKNYGVNIEDLVIGNSYGVDFTESELKREIENALLQHDDIENINSFTITKSGSKLDCSFSLVTTYGTVTEVVTYDN